jgi:hypothetical protein
MIMTPQGPQHILTAPATATVNLDAIKAAMIESAERTDVFQIEYEVTLKREWTGDLAANVFPKSVAWLVEPTNPQEDPAA